MHLRESKMIFVSIVTMCVYIIIFNLLKSLMDLHSNAHQGIKNDIHVYCSIFTMCVDNYF